MAYANPLKLSTGEAIAIETVFDAVYEAVDHHQLKRHMYQLRREIEDTGYLPAPNSDLRKPMMLALDMYSTARVIVMRLFPDDVPTSHIERDMVIATIQNRIT